MGSKIQETKQAKIGDKNYEKLGIVYNVKDLCNNKIIKN